MRNKHDAEVEVLTLIRNSIAQSGTRPSFRAIAEALGYKSPRSVQIILERLRDAGRIIYENGKIDLIPDGSGKYGEETIVVPIVGQAACGALTLAEEDFQGKIRVSTKLAPLRFRHFILKATGNSMNKAGIEDGDLMLIRQQATANDNDIVVAFVDGEATVKRFHRQKGLVVLRPESFDESFEPIVLTADLMIRGIFVAVVPEV